MADDNDGAAISEPKRKGDFRQFADINFGYSVYPDD